MCASHGRVNECLHYSCSVRWQPSPITTTWHVSTPSLQSTAVVNVQKWCVAPSETRSSFDERNINSCSGGCKRRGGESVCVRVHTDEGEGGGITDDILIGLWCQVPACKAGMAGPGCNCVSVARHSFRQGFSSPLAPLRAPTGIRCFSVVLPPLLTHTHKCTLWLCQHPSIWGEFRWRKGQGQQRPGLLCVESIHSEAPRSGFSAALSSV